ncbi:response regulator [Labrys sp. ZIDIC5]|uniref:response regulator n=1 Tax=Labrys sedimenti TaxID=3106036 RepID=UPI002ACA201E|nr:response regulator [Labrys sp. ZIDIC5]MDZ5454757.1 response regulator [Labrys sp. ZIDIC5]
MPSSTPAMVVAVIDDDLDVLGSLRFLLQAEGLTVKTYISGPDCLAQLASSSPDCFIIDYKMDGMDGLQLAQRLRERGQRSPIVLITGYPDEMIEHKVRRAGIQHVVLKPHIAENLIATVRAATADRDGPGDIR